MMLMLPLGVRDGSARHQAGRCRHSVAVLVDDRRRTIQRSGRYGHRGEGVSTQLRDG
jgi:hypothetical protein